jgi:hypothetical protein
MDQSEGSRSAGGRRAMEKESESAVTTRALKAVYDAALALGRTGARETADMADHREPEIGFNPQADVPFDAPICWATAQDSLQEPASTRRRPGLRFGRGDDLVGARDHHQALDLPVLVGAQEGVVVLDRHAAVGIAVGT